MGTGGTILLAIASALGGALGSAVGWVVASFIGAPIRKFFDLRAEVLQKEIEFANVPARLKETARGSQEYVPNENFSSDYEERLDEAQHVFRDLASKIGAFARAEPFAAWAVARMGWNSSRVSEALIGFSNVYDKYGSEKVEARTRLEKALRV
jgi:hypothetical protein